MSGFTGRPQTLAEAVARTNAGEDFQLMFPEFLDNFYSDIHAHDTTTALSRITDEPNPTTDTERHAFIGGVGEHLARRWKLPAIPEWTNHASRFLHKPYIGAATKAMRATLIVQSPLAFRRRLTFIESEPLRRARMPRKAA